MENNSGTFSCQKPNNPIGIDEIGLKCDCNAGSIVNGNRHSILYSVALDKPHGLKKVETPRIEH